MADSLSRARRAQHSSRGSSRTSSARASAVILEEPQYLPNPHGLPNHSLRPAESRFSLHEQFATTRREFEFGFDDSSSVLGRSTIPDSDHLEDTVVLGDVPPPVGSKSDSGAAQQRVRAVHRTYYELLCLPQSTTLSPDDIRSAHRRLIQLLQPELQPEHLVSTTEALLRSVQTAFETLIEPHRRVNYDCEEVDAEISPDELHWPEPDVDYVGQLREEYFDLTHGQTRTTTDLGLRLEYKTLFNTSRGVARRKWRTLTPLDLSLQQSTTFPLPAVRGVVQRLCNSSAAHLPGKVLGPVRCNIPTVTVTGSVHGLMDDAYRLAPMLLDRYQPPGPSIHGRRRMDQLLSSRFLPRLGVRMRQEISGSAAIHKSQTGAAVEPDGVVELETEILPLPAMMMRVGQSLGFAGDGPPLDLEISVRKNLLSNSSPPSSMGFAVHRPVIGPDGTVGGTAFATIDAGDWMLKPAAECGHYSRFSRATKRFAARGGVAPAFRDAPTVEVGYTTACNKSFGLRSGRGLTQPGQKTGLRGMDIDIDSSASTAGSWTVSLGATADGLVAGYLRYGRDVLSRLSNTSQALPPSSSHTGTVGGSGFRAEIELGAAAGQGRDLLLALRGLKRVGRFSRLGVEVGMTPANLHVSLYWSRLGQRLSLPILLAGGPNGAVSSEAVFWSMLVPFLGLAATEIMYWGPRSKSGARKDRKEDAQKYIARRRADADELTTVLAVGVEARQQIERQRSGLVVLSAKYGVKGAAPDEIADVTVAVAALVDKGQLFIPKGLKKGQLLAFWDPAPRKIKVLSVRYLYGGQEQSAEVSGRDELRLP